MEFHKVKGKYDQNSHFLSTYYVPDPLHMTQVQRTSKGQSRLSLAVLVIL